MISDILNNSLREKYNPDGSNRRRAQLRMLEMLVYLDKFCEKNGIKYWIDCGTLLGAVRHKGFIPWDDDVDVCMPYEDYLRFVKLFKTIENDDYVLQNHRSDPGYYRFWSVLRDLKSEYVHTDNLYTEKTIKYKGLQIDIFPVIVKYNDFALKVSELIRKAVNYFWQKEAPKGNLFFSNLLFNLGEKCLFPFFDMLPSKEKEYAVLHYGVGFVNETRKKCDFYPLVRILFEGHYFSAPNSPERYCKRIYGENCLDMPAESDIYDHHVKVIFK